MARIRVNIITHPCPNLNGGLVKTPLISVHTCIVIIFVIAERELHNIRYCNKTECYKTENGIYTFLQKTQVYGVPVCFLWQIKSPNIINHMGLIAQQTQCIPPEQISGWLWWRYSLIVQPTEIRWCHLQLTKQDACSNVFFLNRLYILIRYPWYVSAPNINNQATKRLHCMWTFDDM